MVVIPASTALEIPRWRGSGRATCRPPSRPRLSDYGGKLSTVYCGARGLVPGVIPPPVAITLMKSTPALQRRRVALVTSWTPSASRPQKFRWPPVVVIGMAEARSAGRRSRRADRVAKRERQEPSAAAVPQRGDPAAELGLRVGGGSQQHRLVGVVNRVVQGPSLALKVR